MREGEGGGQSHYLPEPLLLTLTASRLFVSAWWPIRPKRVASADFKYEVKVVVVSEGESGEGDVGVDWGPPSGGLLLL